MTAILVIAALAALVWGVLFFTHAGLLGSAVAVVLAGSVLGHEFFHIQMSPMPITLDRVLFAAMAGQYLVWRRWGLADPKPMTRTDWTLLAFIAWLFIRSFTHAGDLPAIPRLFFNYLMPLGVYWVVRQAKMTERVNFAVLASFAIFAVYLSLTALAENRHAWALVFPRYIYNSPFTEYLGRARGPFLNPVANGLAIGFGWLSTAMLWTRVPRRWRVVLGAAMGLFALGIYCTLTRCVWLGTLGGGFVIVLILLPKWRRLPFVLVCTVVAAALVATQWERLMSFKRDVNLSAAEAAESAQLRPLLAVTAWKMFLDHPVTGVGLCQYDAQSKYYSFDRDIDLPLETARPYTQHNVFLSLLTETGLVGMGLFIAVLTLWFVHAWRLWDDRTRPLWARKQGLILIAMIVAYVSNGMFQDTSQIIMVHTYLFFIAGLTMNSALARFKEESSKHE